MALLRKPSERLLSVAELKAKIMEANGRAKRLAVQDKKHAAKHAEINELLDELDFAR